MSQKQYQSFALLKRLVKNYMAAHKGRLALAFACMVIVAGSMALFMNLLKPLIDEAFINQDQTYMMSLPPILFALTLVRAFASYKQAYLVEFIGQRTVGALQHDLYQRIIRQDMVFFFKNSTATLTSRFTFDLQRLNQAVSNLVGGGLRDITMAIGLLANLLIISWQLTLATFLVVPAIVVPIAIFGRRMRKYSKQSQSLVGILNNFLSETLGNHRQVQSYTMEERESERAESRIRNVFLMTMKAARVRAMSSPMMDIATGLALTLVLYLGLHLSAEGSLTTGAFASFVGSLIALARPIKGLTNLNNALQEGLAAVERTFDLMDHPQTITCPEKNGKKLKVTEGAITFNNVSFTYPDDSIGLDQINISIPAGHMVAIVGESGAGKSTLLNLMPRFFDPTNGNITIDGTDIKTANLKSLRSNIGLVTQEVAIFDDTVFNNIAYGNPKATKKQVVAAAKDAAAHDFIEKLDDGYDTQLGEGGAKLSGGQRQRIAIARALLKNAPILLLDEATASLDSKAEKKVQEGLNRLMQNRTTLVVAHRLSTISNADQIYVLDAGHVVEHGTHTELLAKKGAYYKLHKLQGSEAS